MQGNVEFKRAIEIFVFQVYELLLIQVLVISWQN